MTTEFTNIVISESDPEVFNGESMGEIVTFSTWKVWDCINKKWSDSPPVQMRNILLSAMHPQPKERFCIGEIPLVQDETEFNSPPPDPSTLDPFTPPKSEKYYLDLASGSRTHGRFTFNNVTVGRWYYDADWKRIIYGSIVHTGCKRLRYATLNIIVTDDTLKDENGDWQDDPINGYHWKTGDSHAKASKAFMRFLGAPLDYLTGENPELNYSEQTPLQFRIAQRSSKQVMGEYGDGWIGKGTVAYNPDMDINEGTVDLAIPISCMKGRKLPLGNHTCRVLLGMVFEAEDDRIAKLGWMFWQWFTTDTIRSDGIYDKLIDKIGTVSEAYNNINKCAELMRISRFESYEKLALGDHIEDEAEYENLMTRMIKADTAGILFRHPWIVLRVKQRLQKMWINFAKSLGVRFYSLMPQPDETLAHYHTVNDDGSITGRKVFCAPGFEEGEYIVYSNPMRHWGDIQIWENKYEGDFKDADWGILAVPTKLALSLGRDFDGDWMQLISANKYPNIAQAIREFKDPPVVEKFPKVPLKGHIQKIAVGSMNNYVGLVANTLGKARALQIENEVLTIPSGGMQTEEKEMRIIDFLSQELQIAVDSIKSAYPNNKTGIDYVMKYVKEAGGENILWMAGLKNSQTYLSQVCPVGDKTDTVSLQIKSINKRWKGVNLEENVLPRAFKETLFASEKVDNYQLQIALNYRTNYRQEMTNFIRIKEETGIDLIYDAVIKYRQLGNQIKENDQTLDFLRNTNFTFRSWVASFWRVAHEAETGQAGLVFTMFPDEIVAEILMTKPDESITLIVWGVQYEGWWYYWELVRPFTWCGQEVEIEVVELTFKGKPILGYRMTYNGKTKNLGYASKHEYKYIKLGMKKTMKIFEMPNSTLSNARQREYRNVDGTIYYEKPKLANVRLVESSVPNELAEQFATYKRADGLAINRVFNETLNAKMNQIEAVEPNLFDDHSDSLNNNLFLQ